MFRKFGSRFCVFLALISFSFPAISSIVYAGTKPSSSSKSSSSKSGGSSSNKGWGNSSKSTPAASKPAPKSTSGSSSNSGWGATKPTKSTSNNKSSGSSTNSGWGSNKVTKKVSTPSSPADRALYEKAKVNGKAFKSRDEAISDFKTKNAQKFTSTYAQEPDARPDYIPPTTTYQGSPVTVVYNQSYGGYGYWSGGGLGLGTWMMYDALSDLSMMSYFDRRLSSDGYYYGDVPWGFWGIFSTISVVLIVIVVLTIFVRKG